MADERRSGRYILITGGGGGIGSALAEGISASGAAVFLADVDPDAAERTTSVVAARGWAGCDVRDPVAIENIIDAAYRLGGPIDGLIAAHGLSNSVPGGEPRRMESHRVGQLHRYRPGRPDRRPAHGRSRNPRRHRQHCFQVGLVGVPNRVHYLVSKGGVNLVTRGMALDPAPQRIRVNTIGPGAIVTEMARPRWDDPRMLAATNARTPLGQNGTTA